VQSAVTTLVDQGGPSCMTLPGFRHFVAEKAKSRTYAFLSAYLVAVWKSLLPTSMARRRRHRCHRESGDCQSRSGSRIKAHAEIGGFARWVSASSKMAAEIGRRADIPVYVHFGSLGSAEPAPTVRMLIRS